MRDQIPDYVDPFVMVDRGAKFSGQLDLKSCDRLADFLASADGKVDFSISFSRNGKIAQISGDVHALLNIKCQVCLEAVPMQVDLVVNLAAVGSIEEANRLPEEYEPLLVDDSRISILQVIEDELILAIPDSPRHEFSCVDATVAQTEEVQEAADKPNPFSVLEVLKKK